ncbi:family 10 glycosylhydrolase [candidate division KSB1 bacterium]|nr:family 10 glycosylhydrolase [candidate division KSB1 bacterium]
MLRKLLFHFLVFGIFCTRMTSIAQSVVELRGVWLTNVDSEVLDHAESIDEAMQFLADHHFNAVFPVVWNDAHTLYPSRVMDSLFQRPIHPRFAGRDPLADLIRAAHLRQIAVIPWFEYGFAAAHKKQGGHLLQAKPHWAARDKQGRLLTKNGFEWLNAFHPEVQEFLTALVCEVVRHYPVDGVQGDDRLPALPIQGDYSQFTTQLYQQEHNGNTPPKDFRDSTWQRWRGNRLNNFARQLYQRVKMIQPNVIVSWAPSIFPWSYDEYLQDWPAWLQGGYADLVIPQNYRYYLDEYQLAVTASSPDSLNLTPAQATRIFPGMLINIGKYVIPSHLLILEIQHNRAQGFAGEVFFFYEGLRKNNNLLAKKLRATVYQQPAQFPLATPRQP